jgi:outer membrane protein assembly factor BamA
MSTARTFSFQTGGASGVSAAVQARSRRHLGLDAAEVGVIGEDRTFAELTGRVRAYVPLWGGGHARHVLALQASGGSAFGAGAQRGHFGVGGASGAVEDLTGFELFGGSFVFLPVRGYPTSSRAGAYAWAGSAEYRFPLALVNRGLGAWPLWFDRVVGAMFADAGNAWEPNPLGSVAASVGAEVSVGLVGFWTSGLLVRTGVAVPLVGGVNPQVYVRSGLSF